MILTSSLRNSCENCTHTLQRSRLGSRTGFPKLIGCSSWRTMAGPAITLPTRIASRTNACRIYTRQCFIVVQVLFQNHSIPSFLQEQCNSEKSAEASLTTAAACTERGKVRHPSHDHPTFKLTCVTCEFILQHATALIYEFCGWKIVELHLPLWAVFLEFLTAYTDTWCKFTQSPSYLCGKILGVIHLQLVCMHTTRYKSPKINTSSVFSFLKQWQHRGFIQCLKQLYTLLQLKYCWGRKFQEWWYT